MAYRFMAYRPIRSLLGLGRALGIVCLALLPSISIAWAAEFSGRFEGIGTSTGMRLTLQEAEGRVVGRFDSGRGEPYTLNGRHTGDAAQGSVERGTQSFFFHVERRPLGLQFLLIPRGPDGGPDIAGSTDYSFVQQGLQLPQPSEYKTPPPQGVPVDIIDFIDGFREWSPGDMARVYVGLEDRHRELILLFDHAAAEMLWRICTIKPPSADFTQDDLNRLLDRQGTNCADYLLAVDRARKDGLLGEFVRKANFQFELIRETVKCDRNQSPDTKCADVGAMTSPLLLRWRRAIDLMVALSGEPEAMPATSQASPPATVPEPRQVVAPIASSATVETTVPAVVPEPRAAALPTSDDAPIPVAPLRGSLVVNELGANEVGVNKLEPALTPTPALVQTPDIAASIVQGPVPLMRPGARTAPDGGGGVETLELPVSIVPGSDAPKTDRPFPRARPGGR